MSDERTRQRWLTLAERDRYEMSHAVDDKPRARRLGDHLRDALDKVADLRAMVGLSLPDNDGHG